jgi:hypothetical protein
MDVAGIEQAIEEVIDGRAEFRIFKNKRGVLNRSFIFFALPRRKGYEARLSPSKHRKRKE